MSYSKSTDLTQEEQANVRTAILVLHVKSRSWRMMARALKVEHDSIYRIVTKRRAVTAAIAFRVARLAGASIDDVLSGAYVPAGTCRHCGHHSADT